VKSWFLPDGTAHLEFSVLCSPWKKKEKPIWDLRTTVQPTENHDVVGRTGISIARWAQEYCSWEPMGFELVAVPILPLFSVTRQKCDPLRK
jgi:hypothetical protein